MVKVLIKKLSKSNYHHIKQGASGMDLMAFIKSSIN